MYRYFFVVFLLLSLSFGEILAAEDVSHYLIADDKLVEKIELAEKKVDSEAIKDLIRHYSANKDYLKAYVWSEISHTKAFFYTKEISFMTGYLPKDLSAHLSEKQLDFANFLIEQWKIGQKIDFTQKYDGLSAVEKAKKQGDAGDAEGYYKLGSYYSTGRFGVKADKQKMIEYYQKAAEMGLVKAQVSLGDHYLKDYSGKNTLFSPKRYIDKSLKWFRMAAEAGNPYAEAQMAIFYMTANLEKKATSRIGHTMSSADGVEKKGKDTFFTADSSIYISLERDLKKSLYWSERAANHGHIKAMFLTGVMYLGGEKDSNIEPNFVKAYKWILVSALSGYNPARPVIKQLRAEIPKDVVLKAEAEGLELYDELKKSQFYYY